MEQGIICKEYYIGKFIYLKDMLDNRLANVSFGRFRNEKVVVLYSWDKAKGEFIRRRLSSVNPEWNRLCEIAQTRLRYEEQLELIKNNVSVKPYACGHFKRTAESGQLSGSLFCTLLGSYQTKALSHRCYSDRPFRFHHICMVTA